MGSKKNTNEMVKELVRNGESISAVDVAKKLRISRQMATRYLAQLVSSNVIHRRGSTKSARYSWGGKQTDIPSTTKLVKQISGLQEDEVFEDASLRVDLKSKVNKEAQRIAYYAFSEMLNNAIDHSDSMKAEIVFGIKNQNFEFTIRDFGIGIYNRLKKGFRLKTDLDAIEHLFKGKQTTMPSRHSGQGIFFTSRIADRFEIHSAGLAVVIDNRKQDQLVKKISNIKGTQVHFEIRAKTKKRLKDVFDDYTDSNFEFDRNHVRVKLSSTRELISRSQARKLLAGLEKFRTIVFDFRGVDGIGQAFADEIFRVFPKMNPGCRVEYSNASETVTFMIRRALSGS